MSQPRPQSALHRRLAKDFAALGWSWSFAGSGHIRWSHPDHGQVISSSSPSCRFAARKLRADIKRAMNTERAS